MSDLPEEWRTVVGFPDYEVSSHGRVRSLRASRILAGSGSKYRNVSFYRRDKTETKRATAYTIHRVVAEAFLGPRPPFTEIMHLDGNRYNNRADNLGYGTRAENIQRDIDNGVKKGSRSGNAILDERDVAVIKRLLHEFPTINRVSFARAWGITRQAIDHIEKGRHWTHVTALPVPDLGTDQISTDPEPHHPG